MVDRDVGKMGQSEFEKLCSSVGLARNVSREDRTGWDYLVEFPLPRLPGQPADMAPPALECRVQVKATDKRCRRWSVPLQNLERLAKSPMPAFVCLLEFDGKEHAQQVYLVHIGEAVIGRVLKRLRQLERSPHDAVKKPTLSITCNDSHRFPQPTGVCLKEAIQDHIAEGTSKYCEWKRQLLDTLGYEKGHPRMQVQFSAQDPIQDLIDLSLGYRKSLKVSNISMHDVRFGVECVLPDPHGPAELSISSVPSEGAVIFRERRSSPGVEFTAKVYTPSINRVLPKERVTFRIQAKFFEILVQPFADRARFNLLPDMATIAAGPLELKNLLTLIRMMRSQGSKGMWMDVTMNGQDVLPGGHMFVHSKIHDPTNDLEIVGQALVVARTYGVDDKVSVSLNDILKSRESIGTFYKVIQGQTENATATFYLGEEPTDAQPTSAVISHGCLPLGDFLLYCIVGIMGRLEHIGDKQYRLTSQGNCLCRRALGKKGQKMDEAEFSDICASMEEEMTAKGIGPVIIIEQ
jgi:hypothetical protein